MLRLDKDRGVNAGLELCFFCNAPKGVIEPSVRKELQECGATPHIDGDAPRSVVLNHEPCEKCAGYMKEGVILISAREPANEQEKMNPYRTGGWVVVTDEAIRRVLQPDFAELVLKQRVSFVPDELWDAVGLPPRPPRS